MSVGAWGHQLDATESAEVWEGCSVPATASQKQSDWGPGNLSLLAFKVTPTVFFSRVTFEGQVPHLGIQMYMLLQENQGVQVQVPTVL